MRSGPIIIASRSKTVANIMAAYLGDIREQDISITVSEAELWKAVTVRFPRLLLLESCYCGVITYDLIFRLLKRHRELKIAVFSVEECEPFTAAKYIYWGASSYLDLRDDLHKIGEAVSRIVQGGYYCPKQVEAIAENYECPVMKTELTERERHLVKLFAKGKTNKEIAALLGVSVNTVRNHKSNIYAKCDGHRMADIIRFGIAQGILDIGELARNR